MTKQPLNLDFWQCSPFAQLRAWIGGWKLAWLMVDSTVDSALSEVACRLAKMTQKELTKKLPN